MVNQEAKKIRCHWVPARNTLYAQYHDSEWGVPVHDDSTFFEFLLLESAQAGLSWETILKRREGYRRAFVEFDAKKITHFDAHDITRLMGDEGIIRNRLKVESAISNAQIFLALQEEFGSFSKYAWGFVGGKTLRSPKGSRRVTSPEATMLATDLKRRGFKFFGPVIAYAFMQATGLIDDHASDCFRYRKKR